jgi:hypothetical protein
MTSQLSDSPRRPTDTTRVRMPVSFENLPLDVVSLLQLILTSIIYQSFQLIPLATCHLRENGFSSSIVRRQNVLRQSQEILC